eukprot:TRINITY_DN20216_c0_g1_i1.p1 TRINITY_DN20216_c0_g1~~TRINITY_DN20216_c0_g1_i1.p1  ORF type:complete len:526 (+),score=63.61 TRINITY_DN20216_c0_g1_i1:214-1791(+)
MRRSMLSGTPLYQARSCEQNVRRILLRLTSRLLLFRFSAPLLLFLPIHNIAVSAVHISRPTHMFREPVEALRRIGYPNGCIRQTLENVGDAQYMGTIHVGGQPLKTIFDTGSFELMVLSSRCSNCMSNPRTLFNEHKSQTFKSLHFVTQHSFGSGDTWSEQAVDILELGNYTRRQHFWNVIDADMPTMRDIRFQALLGLGPPRSALKFAKEAAEEAREEELKYVKSHQRMPKRLKSEIHHNYAALSHLQRARNLVDNINLHSLSICFGRSPGSPGYLAFGDTAVEDNPQRFLTVPVVGDTYWSTSLSDVVFGKSVSFVNDSLGWSMPRVGGCVESPCTAILDTGTSLIMAPRAASAEVNAAFEAWEASGGRCSDLTGLPTLDFKLGGYSFSLPPEVYVGQIRGPVADEIASRMPSLRRESVQDGCVPLVMSSDSQTEDGEVWVLGIPFFREYFTSFNLETGQDGLLEATSISFAPADVACRPAAEIESLFRRDRKQSWVPAQVDGSKLRMPDLVSRHKLPRFSSH